MEHIHFFTFLILTSIIATVTSKCPAECICSLDHKGRHKVSCVEGGMIDPIPVVDMESTTEIIEISSPENNMNLITLGPIFGNFKNLEELHITRSNIPNIGMLSFYGLTRLTIMNLTQNNISGVLDSHFRGLVRLEELHLDDNRIDRLPSGTFRFVAELRLLSMTNNRIDELLPRLFLMLAKLQTLKLSGNHLTKLNPEVFADIKELKTFECRRCGLQTIDKQMYNFLPELQKLDLGDNHLKHIESDEFSNLANLQTLQLDGNYFTTILDNTFSNQHNLQSLNLARNRLMKISDNAFHNLTNLTDLNIGYNKMEKFDGRALKQISSTIEYLVLSGNKLPLRDIRSAIHAVEQVKDLELADMGLNDLPLSLIPEGVRSLNLAGNYMPYLSDKVFPDHLVKLDLSRNRFRGLDERALSRLEAIPNLNLDRNPWSCDLCHINHMILRANSTTFSRLRCSFPYPLEGRFLGSIRMEELEMCSTQAPDSFLLGEDGRLGMIAAGASFVLIAFTCLMLIAAFCYSRRHAANYYTHEDKRGDEREAIFDDSTVFGDNPEISFKFPLDFENGDKKISICTIDEIKKEHCFTNGSM